MTPEPTDSRESESLGLTSEQLAGDIDADTLAKAIDHTLLYKDHHTDDIDSLVEEANKYGMNVCVPPCRVEQVVEKGVEGEIAAVIGFPHGLNTTETKVHEAYRALEDGATELDVACNVSDLKSRRYYEFRDDIERIVETGGVVKAIIETGILSRGEKKKASELCAEAGAHYVKTCTGFSEGRATVEDVRLMKDVVGNDAKVKASGGIGSYEKAKKMFEAGASRIGASSGVEIIESFLR